jgi:hypothetical protein
MPLRTYDPKNVIVTFGGIALGGFADGTFVAVERENDAFSKESGADGVVSRAKSNDKSGNATITLSQTSPSNDILSIFHAADESANEGVKPFVIKEIGSGSLFVSAFGWIRKIPSIEYAKEISTREWTIDLADLDVFVGGVPNNE